MLSAINREIKPAETLDEAKDRRILWLINHTTLREFEVPLLRSMGFEIFTPKYIPELVYGWSGSVDDQYDETLTIPKEALNLLNAHNFYDDPIPPQLAEIINQYFGTAFCVFWPKMIDQIQTQFNGRILLRAFGLDKRHTYWNSMVNEAGNQFIERLKSIGNRFWFAQCYENLSEVESEFIKSRTVTLPLGLPSHFFRFENTWVGGVKKILFFCARIETSAAYYGKIYEEFKEHFGDLPYVVAGTQPVPVKDKNVAGHQPREVIDEWLRTYAVMFYHSQEPRHLHYHPLEAIIFGMPLIYMRGGMLERLGGKNQPGACATYAEARKKVQRVLSGDKAFIEEIRHHQKEILKTFNLDFNFDEWQSKFVTNILKKTEKIQPVKKQIKKIGIFLPIPYQGGSLNGAKNIAKMIYLGSQKAGEQVEIVFSCVEGSYDVNREFSDLKEMGIQIRETHWKRMHVGDLTFSCLLSSIKTVNPYDEYLLPMDGINNFNDCDFWFVISDRFGVPLAPIKPYGLMVYDYIQRYVPEVVIGDDATFLSTARNAHFVLTTTPTTYQDAIQYAGINPNRLFLAPMEFNPFTENVAYINNPKKHDYIIWPSNIAMHKNHMTAFDALEIYYHQYRGKLKTYMTGYMTQHFDLKCKDRNTTYPYVQKVANHLSQTKYCKQNFRALGNLTNADYLALLADAKFLFHPTLIDNGTYAVIEAAYHGIPSLSSNYPQMHFINERFRLNLGFFDQHNPKDIAEKLMMMEEQYEMRQQNLPKKDFLDQFSYTKIAPQFWDLIRSLI